MPVEVRAAVSDPSGRQTRGWAGRAALVALNLVYLSAFGLGVYWLLFVSPVLNNPEHIEGLPPQSGAESALKPLELEVRKSRLERALEVYRFDTGKYPNELRQLLGNGYISSDYAPTVDLTPIEYVTIGSDFELR